METPTGTPRESNENVFENQITADIVHDDNQVERATADFDHIEIEADDFHAKEDDDLNNAPLLIIDLPDVALVRVLEYLNLKERYYLSLTCKLFYDLFTHPHLWQKAHIDLLCTGDRKTKDFSRWKLKTVMNTTMIEIVKRFSHLFQHLSLNLDGNIQKFDDVAATLLDQLRSECRLESLTLKLGPLTSSNDYVRHIMSRRSNTKDVPLVVGLIQSTFRLKRLNIVSWPLFLDMKDNNILQVIQSHEKLKSLESLSLFFIDMKKPNWTERIPKLPSVEQTLDVLSFLSNLTHLALRSPMISNEILLLLASRRRAPLKLLQILVMFSLSSPYDVGFRIPEIASSSWKSLNGVSPHLKVELFVQTRIPAEELQAMLKPGMPLSSLSLFNYSQCNSMIIDFITSHHSSTFTAFYCLCDSSYCDQALINLLKTCHGLKYLVFHGDINYTTIVKLAELTKGGKNKWELFQFKQQNIKTEYLDEEYEDVVVKYDAVNEEYYLGGIHSWHVDEKKHQEKIDEMIEYVRNALGTTHNLFAP